LETTKDDHYLALAGICANVYEELRVSLEAEIDILTASETSLLSQVSECEAEVASLESLLTAEYADNDALRAERDALLLQIDSLNTQISTLQSEKSALGI
jgi:chromosome segregation ATPase